MLIFNANITHNILCLPLASYDILCYNDLAFKFTSEEISCIRLLKETVKIVDFDISKISAVITKAFDAQEMPIHPNVIDFLALKVTADFAPKIKDDLIAVESIQDSVESVLVQAGYADVAKAFILYRKQREKLRNMKSTILRLQRNG